ncbi:unnamed protein product, partial [Diplocarpon coronariae]
GLPQRRN